MYLDLPRGEGHRARRFSSKNDGRAEQGERIGIRLVFWSKGKLASNIIMVFIVLACPTDDACMLDFVCQQVLGNPSGSAARAQTDWKDYARDETKARGRDADEERND